MTTGTNYIIYQLMACMYTFLCPSITQKVSTCNNILESLSSGFSSGGGVVPGVQVGCSPPSGGGNGGNGGNGGKGWADAGTKRLQLVANSRLLSRHSEPVMLYH